MIRGAAVRAGVLRHANSSDWRRCFGTGRIGSLGRLLELSTASTNRAGLEHDQSNFGALKQPSYQLTCGALPVHARHQAAVTLKF
jgi:hypothetical protein